MNVIIKPHYIIVGVYIPTCTPVLRLPSRLVNQSPYHTCQECIPHPRSYALLTCVLAKWTHLPQVLPTMHIANNVKCIVSLLQMKNHAAKLGYVLVWIMQEFSNVHEPPRVIVNVWRKCVAAAVVLE